MGKQIQRMGRGVQAMLGRIETQEHFTLTLALSLREREEVRRTATKPEPWDNTLRNPAPLINQACPLEIETAFVYLQTCKQQVVSSQECLCSSSN